MNFEKYNHDLSYSYAFGAFGTIELLKHKCNYCKAVLIDPSFTKSETFDKIKTICDKNNVEIIIDSKTINKIKDKDNIFVIGVFNKYISNIDNDKHIIIYGIDDVGTIGTIIRSMNGFNCNNLILINCNIDIFDEHLIRASMGAFFNVNIKKYDNIDKYLDDYNEKTIINISNEGKDNIKFDNDNSVTYLFSNKMINHQKIINYKFDKDISIDNIVNIVLFSTYKGK